MARKNHNKDNDAMIRENIEIKDPLLAKTSESEADISGEEKHVDNDSNGQAINEGQGAIEGKRKKLSKKKEKSNYEKTTWTHKMKVLGTLLVLGVFTGSGLGVWYFNVNLKSKVDYSGLKVEDYQADINEVFSRNFNITTKADMENWQNLIGDKTPASLSVEPTNTKSNVDNFLLACYNATLAKSFLFTGNGKAVAMGIPQTVYSQRRYNGDYYTFESISKGTLTVANLDVYRPNDALNKNNIDIYVGRDVSQQNANWHYNQTISTSDYETLTGSLPSGISPYIISEKTVKSSNFVYNDETKHYTINFDLDPVTSALLYYKEVRRTGGLEANPEFYSIKYTAIIDENWNLVSTEVFETYKVVKFGIGTTCNGTIKIDYLFNIDVIMPTLKGK